VFIVVTGMLVGDSSPTTLSFKLSSTSAIGLHCERLAMIAAAKPGKYQLAIGVNGGDAACRLILRTP